MLTRGLLNRLRSMRIIAVFLALLLSYGLVSFSPRADSELKLFSIDLGGVTGGANNMVLVFGRYVLVAPFAPSQGVMENGDLDLEQLDNDLLYLIDTKKPNSPAISKELKTWNPRSGKFNKVFYPSRVVFDPSSNNVCVRGTKFEENNDTIEAIDVIAYVNFSEDTNGKPVFDSNVVLIEIPGVTTPHTSDAPLDFAFSSAGDVLVFTNGASVFSFDLAEGFLQELNIVDPADFGDNDSISSIDLDSTTNILSICRERTPVSQTDVVTSSSDLSFYRLNQNGSFQFLKRVNGDSLAGGEALAMDSNIEIISDPGKADSELALFVTNRGSLCTVDLHEDGDSATIRRLYNYPELAQAEPGNASQLTVKYDSSTRIVGIVSSGFSIQIARPVNGKRRRIARPVNVHITSGPAVLAMAKLNKKNKLASVNSFTGDFTEEGGLSNFVRGQDAQWLISTYSGKLYSVNLADDLKDSALEFVGSLGSNVDRIDYYSDRSSIVAINSFTPDEEGIRMASRGSLVVARITESTGALVQALLPTASALTKPGASIRRPCNVRR